MRVDLTRVRLALARGAPPRRVRANGFPPPAALCIYVYIYVCIYINICIYIHRERDRYR